MSDDRADPILVMLRAIRAQQDEHTAALQEIRRLIGLLEAQCSSGRFRSDRRADDLERSTWRLDSANMPDV
jgi:hypothetical protein